MSEWVKIECIIDMKSYLLVILLRKNLCEEKFFCKKFDEIEKKKNKILWEFIVKIFNFVLKYLYIVKYYDVKNGE